MGLSLPRVALRRGRQRPRRARHEADLGVKAVAAPPAPRWTCYTKRTSVLVERGRGRRDGAHVRVHRSEELLRQRRMRRPRAGPADGEPRRGRSRPHGEDHLPGHHAVHEGARPVQPLPRVRDPRERGLRHGEAAHAALHGGVGRHLLHLPALRVARGRPSLFHRRMLHRCDAVPVAVPDERPGVRRHAHGGGAGRDGRARHGRGRAEPVLGESGARHHGEARPGTASAFSTRPSSSALSRPTGPSPISGTSARASRGAWRSTRCTTCAAYAR